MSTLNPTRKVSRKRELREDTVITFYARALGYFENNRNVVFSTLAGIVVLVAVIMGMSWMNATNNAKALTEMAVAVQKFEAGEFQASLDGDASFTGMIVIADKYGSSASGNLARFYVADAFFRVGNMDSALEYFEAYSKGSDYLGASAYAGEAAIHELNGELKKAGDLFLKAANIFSSDITSPMYLESAARAYGAAGEAGKALSAYETIKEDYPDTQAARNADFFLAKFEAAK